MSVSSAPTVPVLSAEQLRESWAERGPVALCIGGFGSPREQPHDRVGLFTWPPDGSGPVLDVWLPSAQLDSLELGTPVYRGGWDTMYATGWSVAWAEGHGEARLWTRDGVRLVLQGETLQLVEEQLPLDRVEAVASFLSEDWVQRGLQLRLRDAGPALVVQVEEPIASMGALFYDGIDLLADSAWLHAAGRGLAAALGRPYQDGIG